MIFILNARKFSSFIDKKEIEFYAKLGKAWMDEIIGCGGGILSFPLVRLGAFVTGIDACKESIVSATNFVNYTLESKYRSRVNFQYTTVQEFSKNRENTFDIVIASEVLEHVPDVKDFVNKCALLTKYNGTLFISATNKTFLSNLLAIKFAENIAGLLPSGSHNWEKFVKPEYLIQILSQNNVSVKSYRGLTYNPFTNNWLWINNTDVNYFLIGKKNLL